MSRTCVFLDRDGVINHKATPGEYIAAWEEFRFIPAIFDWIRLFNALGHLVIVVTNQRGVATGKIDPEELERIHRNMREALLAAGARVDDVFVCPHEEGACECRKPRTGMVEAAVSKWDIELERSIMIGDSQRDWELAAACGIRFVEVDKGRIVSTKFPLDGR